MIDYMNGVLVFASGEQASIESAGIAYRLWISPRTHSYLPMLGSACTLYVSTLIREDEHRMYGFLSRGERDLFEQLLTVSGIGPKTALSILGHPDLSFLQQILITGDVQRLSKIPGLGKKTAERLVMELKDKKLPATLLQTSPLSSAAHDAISALTRLGYTASQAQKAIQACLAEQGELVTLPELITRSLQLLKTAP